MRNFQRHESMDPANWQKMAFGWACQQARIWGWTWKWDTSAGFEPCYLIDTNDGTDGFFALNDHDFVKLVSDQNRKRQAK